MVKVHNYLTSNEKFFALFLVPSGAPLDFRVTATEVDSVSLAWEPVVLEERNGVILGYVVTLTSLLGTEPRQIDTEFTNASVPFLAPYTMYECTVLAYTSVGIGPPSEILLVRTRETCNLLPCLYTILLVIYHT